MPLYTFVCSCGRRQDVFRKIEGRNEPEPCPNTSCEQYMQRVVDMARVQASFAPYDCPITGVLIDSPTKHRENLAKNGCRVLEPGEDRDAESFRRAKDLEFQQKFEESVVQQVTSMPKPVKEILAGELVHGAGTDMSSVLQHASL